MINNSGENIALGKSMKKVTIKNIISTALYYVLGIMGFYLFFIFAGFFSEIDYFSNTLFRICYVVIPIIILLLPVILKFVLKREFYQSVVLSLISVPIYFILIYMINFGISSYMEKFTLEKWEKYQDLRYLMIDDLEKQYHFAGMKKEEALEILGKDYEYENRIYYFIRSAWLRSYYYCLEYDENGTITTVYIDID